MGGSLQTFKICVPTFWRGADVFTPLARRHSQLEHGASTAIVCFKLLMDMCDEENATSRARTWGRIRRRASYGDTTAIRDGHHLVTWNAGTVARSLRIYCPRRRRMLRVRLEFERLDHVS